VRTRSLFRFLGALLATNLKAAWTLRGAFWAQVLLMIGNDLIWFTVWILVYARFPEIGGWRLADMAVLQGVLAAAFGVSVLLAYGVKELAHAIDEGELDPLLAQPKPVLLHALASRTSVSGIGDVAYGVGLLALYGGLDAVGALRATAAVVLGAVALTSASVLFHAAAFWLGPVQPLAQQAREFLVMFSGYPETIFAGGLRGLLFTVVPAGFAAWMPAAVVRDFSWGALAAAAGGAAALAAVAVLVFRAGLRRSASGSRIAVRA
jgi:ABC-2 type transport system permease protein